MGFRHHALQHLGLACQLPAKEAYQFHLVRHRQPREVFADIELDPVGIGIAAAASLKAIVLVNRCCHLSSTLPPE
jgi:hypothetical protein